MKINKEEFKLTVITPTIGRNSLNSLIESIENQTIHDEIFHIIMWDEYREDYSIIPEEYNSNNRWNIILPWGLGKFGNAPGSSLRAVAMMAAFTPYVTFADDDVSWDIDHAETMLNAIGELNWAGCLRKIYMSTGEYLGEDRFESVGDDLSRKVPYEMIDGNCLIFKREFGVVASQLYRFTTERNDDRLLYNFLKEHAGIRGKTNKATINHICPDFLIEFFRNGCIK